MTYSTLLLIKTWAAGGGGPPLSILLFLRWEEVAYASSLPSIASKTWEAEEEAFLIVKSAE